MVNGPQKPELEKTEITLQSRSQALGFLDNRPRNCDISNKHKSQFLYSLLEQHFCSLFGTIKAIDDFLKYF